MSGIAGAILGAVATAAARVGAKVVGQIVGGFFGDKGGALAESVIGEIAQSLGVAPDDIPAAAPGDLDKAVAEVEQMSPELIAMWAKGLDGQFALLQAEQKEGPWQSGWRWGWMYLLALFWTCYVLVFPVMAAAGVTVEKIDAAILLTLTTWFISLYMGGHTVKALGESAIAAVKSWRATP